MKNLCYLILAIGLFAIKPALAIQRTPVRTPETSRPTAAPLPSKTPASAASVTSATPNLSDTGLDVGPQAKVVLYSNTDIIRIKAKLRFTTLIVLPKNEKILDFTSGDRDLWVVDGNENFAYVKPTQSAIRTNLNLIAASGNVYSFLVEEISQQANTEADLKVFVELKDPAMLSSALNSPRFVSSQVVDESLKQVDAAKEESRQVRIAAQTAVDNSINRFISILKFPYRFEVGKKPFDVRAIYNDGRSTFIIARPEEVPALYEIKDGKPNLVNFTFQDGVYRVDKVLDSGFLTLGKEKLSFQKEK